MTDSSLLSCQTIRIIIISDTHGFIDPRILELVKGCDAAIHAGDIGSKEVLESLRSQCRCLFAVSGNNDLECKWDPAESETVRSLRPVHTIALPGGLITVEHGHTIRDTRRYHEVLRRRYPNSRAVVYGHTHARVIDRSESPWIINPGASGRVRTRGGPPCLILEATSVSWAVTEHCFPNVTASVNRSGN